MEAQKNIEQQLAVVSCPLYFAGEHWVGDCYNPDPVPNILWESALMASRRGGRTWWGGKSHPTKSANANANKSDELNLNKYNKCPPKIGSQLLIKRRSNLLFGREDTLNQRLATKQLTQGHWVSKKSQTHLPLRVASASEISLPNRSSAWRLPLERAPPFKKRRHPATRLGAPIPQPPAPPGLVPSQQLRRSISTSEAPEEAPPTAAEAARASCGFRNGEAQMTNQRKLGASRCDELLSVTLCQVHSVTL